MRKKKKDSNFFSFIYYSSIIIILTIILLVFLTVKNQCLITRSEIISLDKSIIKQTGIVKELQSKKDYHFSEKYISEMIKGKMKVVTPESVIIIVPEDMVTNE